jgi:hypothetical protein
VVPTSRRQRHGPCLCGSGRPLSVCCLPWEEAFQRLVARLLAFAGSPRIRRLETRAAGIFTNSEQPLVRGKGPSAASSLSFLEWFLQDYAPRRGEGPLLGEFADGVQGLSPREEELLLASLLTPMRAWEVTEVLGLQGLMVKDLLVGAESHVGPLGLPSLPIRSDILICRLLPTGRVMRPGMSVTRLPATSREEMLAYLRTAYQLARPARHVSLEDFLDGAAHLYHHYFLHRGRALGGRTHETARCVTYAPNRLTYQAVDTARIRAGLNRQSELELEDKTGEEIRYAWLDLGRGIIRATLVVRPGMVEVRAETREDLAEAGRFLEDCLRGFIQPTTSFPEAAGFQSPPPSARTPVGPGGTGFLARFLDRWPERSSPLVGDRTPRAACASRGGRQQVSALLLGLERDLARQRRLGRAWADLTPIREALNLLTVSSRSPAA